ncbi:hypothetical protein Ddye_020731 [Dipteronia dyeriana]|uniref:Uncharacterized protein n=1 Tax=Dipteronia dyeriana TaxID=168575 RepID=A0AAD9U0B2_9ROSI|nr:hypothetical protein Ddye_020731 [Dipteronia dyeriana]
MVKRRKITHAPPRSTVPSTTGDKARDVALTTSLTVSVPPPPEIIQIQAEKNFAVEQAQKEGCTGNFRSFDSPFKNYLVPVIPTRKELAE